MADRPVFDSISPIDFRYWDQDVAAYLSDGAFTRYKLAVEVALVTVLYRYGIVSRAIWEEIKAASEKVESEKVYLEEQKVGHDIRALVNCLKAQLSTEAKPYVHLAATSYDISDTANAMRYKGVVENVVVPYLLVLERRLIDLTLREVETPQIARTHGQHAVPITFGFAMAEYVSRLGKCIESLKARSWDLRGKFSGAVGAYNAISLLVENPVLFEIDVLSELDLSPGEHSTQIVQSEPMARLLYEVVLTGGVIANLADDLRNLQRTEIAEVVENFGKEQVGSSTMPQKRNPIGSENVKSLWKIAMPRIFTVLLDQISEHQRDLTNSASSRTYGEIIAYTVALIKRMTKVLSGLEIHREQMQKNLELEQDLIAAEPLYIILASLGHPDAHEKVRQLSLRSRAENASLKAIAFADAELEPYFMRITPRQMRFIAEPLNYDGCAAQKAKTIALMWKHRLNLAP